jgi:hypothetical protein
MEVATDTQLFELLHPTETDLHGFKVTLVVGGHDTVLTLTNADENFTIFPQLFAINTAGVTISLPLFVPSTSLGNIKV